MPSLFYLFFSVSLCSPLFAQSKFSIFNGDDNSVVNSAGDFDLSRVSQISWKPRAFVYRRFLSNEECDHLIGLAKDKLVKSMVADNESGKSVSSKVRTSSGMFLAKKQMKKMFNCSLYDNHPSYSSLFLLCQDEIISRIEERIATWTFLPSENGESIQILHYENGEKYEPHFDFFHDKTNQKIGGHRIATVLMYLSNVEKGGETIFPNAEEKNSQAKDDTFSDCAKSAYAVKPQKGDALLFFSLHPNATTDNLSLHGSCPVLEGEKWSATKWIHVRSFETNEEKRPEGCVDENALCANWAAVGECIKNARYMVGDESGLGYCRKSCKVC